MRSHLSTQAVAQPRITDDRPRRAVVLGGSLAGLLAARVLVDHFGEVVVVDRDDLEGDLTGPRRGVTQARHTHGLLVGGTDAVERLLPGFADALVARGALRADVMGRSRWLMSDNILCRRPAGLVGLLASRTLVESEVRRRVAGQPRVVLLGRQEVLGLRTSQDGTRVAAVVLAPLADRAVGGGDPSAGHEHEHDLAADLVVDATGRMSRAPQWLADLGFPVPQESIVDAGVRYVTRLFHDRDGLLEDLDADIVGTRPDSGRAGVALRQEQGRWTVTLAEQFGQAPPTDLDAFRAFARTLPTQGIATITQQCEPIGEGMRFTYRSSRWRHWERLDRRLDGLIVIGDAVCSFNPIYGQGMSSAALQALRLRDLLAEKGTRDIAARSATAFARVVATPWTLATGSDRRFPGQPAKPLPDRVVDRYLDRLLEVATEDADLAAAFGRVLNLLAAPPSLLAPALAWRVVGPRSHGIVRRARAARAERAAAAPSSTSPGQGLGALSRTRTPVPAARR